MKYRLGHERDCEACMHGLHGRCAHWTIDPDTDEEVACECWEGGHA